MFSVRPLTRRRGRCRLTQFICRSADTDRTCGKSSSGRECPGAAAIRSPQQGTSAGYQRSVLKYFRPESQMMITTLRPSSGPARSCNAAIRFAPDEKPAKNALCRREQVRTLDRLGARDLEISVDRDAFHRGERLQGVARWTLSPGLSHWFRNPEST